MHPAQPGGERKARTDGHAVKERVHGQSAYDRVAGADGEEFAGMRLFAKMKVRRDGVLKKMDDAIARQHQRRSPSRGDAKALGNHLEKGSGHHEPCTQRDEVAQVTPCSILARTSTTPPNTSASAAKVPRIRESVKVDMNGRWNVLC